MMLFIVCSHCKETVENRETLDICQFVRWKCPLCGEQNEPVGRNVEEVDVFEDGETVQEEIVLEVADIDPENMKDSII